MNNVEENNYQVFDMTQDYWPPIVIDPSKNGLQYKVGNVGALKSILIYYEFHSDFNNENFRMNFHSLFPLYNKLSIDFKIFNTHNCSIEELNNQRTAIKVIKQALGELNAIENKDIKIDARISVVIGIADIFWNSVKYSNSHIGDTHYHDINDLSELDNLLKKIDAVVIPPKIIPTPWYKSKIFIGIVIAFAVSLIVITIILIKRNKNNKKVS